MYLVFPEGLQMEEISAQPWEKFRHVPYVAGAKPIMGFVSRKWMENIGRKKCCWKREAACPGGAAAPCDARKNANNVAGFQPFQAASSTSAWQGGGERKRARAADQAAACRSAIDDEAALRTSSICSLFMQGKVCNTGTHVCGELLTRPHGFAVPQGENEGAGEVHESRAPERSTILLLFLFNANNRTTKGIVNNT